MRGNEPPCRLGNGSMCVRTSMVPQWSCTLTGRYLLHTSLGTSARPGCTGMILTLGTQVDATTELGDGPFSVMTAMGDLVVGANHFNGLIDDVGM